MTGSFEINRNPDPAQTFIEGYGAVQRYNDQHVGPTGITSAAMMEVYRSEQPGYEEPDVSPLKKAEIDRDKIIEDQEAKLAELGIELDVQPPSGLIYNPVVGPLDNIDRNKIPPLIILKIGEAEKFGRTVEALNPEADTKELVEAGINQILENTLRGVKDTYRGLTGDDEASKAFQRHDAEVQMDALVDLNPVLMSKNYGSEKLRQELAACIIRHQDDTLEEYVRAEDMELLKPDGGVAGWILFMDAASLESAWLAAIDLLRDLRDKEGGSQFYPELFAKVKGDFNEMLARLQDKDWLPALTVGTDPETRIRSLNDVAARLKEVWSEEFTLENLFHLEGGDPDEPQ